MDYVREHPAAGIRLKRVAERVGVSPTLLHRWDTRRAGRQIATAKNNDPVTLADGVELLVYDTAVIDPPGSTESLYELDTPPKRIGEVATHAPVQSLPLSHLTGRVDDHASEVMASVQAGFKGEVRFAHDSPCIELDVPRPP